MSVTGRDGWTVNWAPLILKLPCEGRILNNSLVHINYLNLIHAESFSPVLSQSGSNSPMVFSMRDDCTATQAKSKICFWFVGDIISTKGTSLANSFNFIHSSKCLYGTMDSSRSTEYLPWVYPACKHWDYVDFKTSFLCVWNVGKSRQLKGWQMHFISTSNPSCTSFIPVQKEQQIRSLSVYVGHFILTTWSWWTARWWHCSKWSCLSSSMSLWWGIRYGVLLIAFCSRWSRAPSVQRGRRRSPRGTPAICSSPPLSSHITPRASNRSA